MPFRYRIELDLKSNPEELWPLVSDTDRFNRDVHSPAVEVLGNGKNARRQLRVTRLGMPLEWEEEPFEWVSPHRFSVLRRYTKGPVESMSTSATLEPRRDGGTHLVYEIEAKPRNLLGWFAIPIEIGQVDRRRFADVFRRYDNAAQDERTPLPTPRPQLTSRAETKIEEAGSRLVDQGEEPELAARLAAVIAGSDDLTVARLRPYVLAETWGTERRKTLELCLRATQVGMLELRWELLCPLCRGTAAIATSLADVANRVHCENCGIDFTADFERSVEVTFRPAPAIRPIEAVEFSAGGPQQTPHIVAQQLVPARAKRSLETELEPGSYRIRTLAGNGAHAVAVAVGGYTRADVRLGNDGWTTKNGGLSLDERATLTVENATAEEQLIVLERTTWSDRSATGVDVTSLQLFRDLFGADVLEPRQQIPVGNVTIVFTDLRGSTRYYREAGDGAAFGRIVTHFELLKAAIAEGDGAMVKVMGDAAMAVFPRPAAAVKTMLDAQTLVAGNPLDLRVGIHTGRCVAVNQNGVLDYFGSSVNFAARLAAFSSGGNLVVSEAVLNDPDVQALKLHAQPVEDTGVLRGFEDEEIELWRLWP